MSKNITPNKMETRGRGINPCCLLENGREVEKKMRPN